MPFASSRRPSLQLGLLKGLAERVDWQARTLHLNLDFAALIGRARYEVLCQHRGTQLSDWIFARAAFGADAPDSEAAMLAELPQAQLDELVALGVEQPAAWFARMRAVVVPAYLDAAAKAVAASGADVVGFTSTFQQNTASFALARWLKQANPALTTVFGGANFDDVMGLEFVRAIGAIDYAVIGEGDEAFPELLTALATGGDAAGVPGVASRTAGGKVRHAARGAPFDRLDSLPIPDYAEYFARAEQLGFFADQAARAVDLPVEGARGCWWGQKHHCVFCGLNAGSMKFRAKSPQRFLDEVIALSRTYRSLHIETVDNIMDMGYFDSVLPAMAQLQASWNIFYEVKSNLTPDQIHSMAKAGICRIQPGIESLSSPLLKSMRKGVRAIQNVNLLRWCSHHGISVSWNLLWGFPGETAAHYEQQRALIPLLVHLQPPGGQGRLWMERFSPLFTQRELMGVSQVVPASSYRHVYPASVNLERAAYFFDYLMADALPEESFEPLVDMLDLWRAARKADAPPRLHCLSAPGYLRLNDQRGIGHDGVYELDGELAQVYMAFFDKPVGMPATAASLGMDLPRLENAVDAFVEQGLMMREGSSALALALPSRAPT